MFVVTAVLLVFKLPTPLEFLQDPDWGLQLSGANQILRGQHPFADYDAMAGPLTFYASASGQKLGGTRVIGEILIVIVGFSIGYTLLFGMIYSITNRNLLIASGAGAVLVLSVPRLYKYYIVLVPALVLWFAWHYVERPSRKAIWLLGGAVAFAGLFRSDFGGYAALSAALAVAIAPHRTPRERVAAVLEFLLATLVAAMPWLVWSLASGGLEEYLFSSTFGAAQLGSGMSLPFPKFVLSDPLIRTNRFLMTLVGFWLIVAITLLTVIADKQAANRRKMWVALVLAAFCLIQAMHRVGEAHLLQAIPMTFVPIGWLIGQAVAGFSARKMRFLPGVGAIVSVTVILLLLSLTFSPWLSLVRNQRATLDDKLETYTYTRDDFFEHVAEHYGDAAHLRAFTFVAHCTTRQDRIIAWPYLLSAYYFIDRPFGTREMGVWPGSYDSVEKQEEIIQELVDAPPPFFIYKPFRFNADVRTMEDFVPVLYAFLIKNYVLIETYGDFSIYVHHEQQANYECTSSTG